MKKIKSEQENEEVGIDQNIKKIVKQRMIQKRVDNILKIGLAHPKVSDPVPYIKKKWVSPLEVAIENKSFEGFK